MTNTSQDGLDALFERYHLNGIGQGGLTSAEAKAAIQRLLLQERLKVLKQFDKDMLPAGTIYQDLMRTYLATPQVQLSKNEMGDE